MASTTLSHGTVTWLISNQIDGARAAGANGYVEFEASAVAFFHGGITVLPSPQRAEVTDGEMAPIDLPVNNPDIWNWKVTPRVGVVWPAFHVDVTADGTDLSSAAITPGNGPVRVLQGPQGGSVVGAEDQGDGTIRFVLDDGTLTKPMPITRGPAGPANEIGIGIVSRGVEPSATLTGTAPAQKLNLVLPKGDPGNPEDLINATPEQRGLMSADDKSHLDQTLTADQVVESTEHTLVRTNSVADNFEAIDARYVTRLDVRGNNVMQAFGRDSKGMWYVTQVHGSGRDMSVTRCDAGGRAIDSTILLSGGHGSPWGFEEIDGEVYMWIWWNTVGVGEKNTFRRWKYTPGRQVPITDPSVEKLPDYFSNVAGFENVNVSINQRLDLLAICLRINTGTSVDVIQLRRLSEYKAGIDNVIAQLPPIPLGANGAFQGFVPTMEHCYVHRGMSGAWPQSPHMDQYRWSDGQRIGQKDFSHLSYMGVNGGKAEAEGLFPIWDDAGRMGLLFGIENGANGANTHNIYSIAPKDFQADTGEAQTIQRLYAPLKWVNVPLSSGFAYRGSGYELQVARDASGMVYLRGHMSTQGFNSPTSATTFAQVPLEYRPSAEVRWMGFRSGLGSISLGGYISASNGNIILQADAENPEGPRPGGHFCIITQPWQAKA